MKELYGQTKERLKTIEDYLKPNVKIHTIWECEFDQQKYPEVDPHLKPIDKRDAFYGGRTETIQLYNNLSDLKEHITKIVFNENIKDISTMILDENIVLTEYKEKEEYSKPNPSVNVYIALFTTAHARLKLYELLDILQERVLYMDTDSCIYNDDGSEACKKVENMMGSKLGDLTDEIVSKHNANHIKQFISAGPKDYSMKLDTEKLVSCCKAYTEKDDPDAKVILGRIMLSDYQICCLRDDGECPLTPKQMEVMEKFKGKKLSKFPPGWDAFIRPDKVYEYVFEKPCPEI
ncbi:unnamed protein product [Mytilus coruscus]|uniref:Uncharacterized protein n=1 Tax=Mytilus coruscus TaxID=42192 RepID=A0A6J8A072_MYTCO|nr:unnamed protein product [Mytilus coruscus]